MFEGKRVLVTGGTGSLGQALIARILTGELGCPEKVTVFSRDETKQHAMRLAYLHRLRATDDAEYDLRQREALDFVIGDIRNYGSVLAVVREADVVIHAAAMKQVPTAEYFPAEAIETNVIGAVNLARAVRDSGSRVTTIIGVSTDKACKPVNVMGMSKALMERILIEANRHSGARFVCVRYGNVIASRGSVVPLILEQIAHKGPITITTQDMTRFLLTLDYAVDTIFSAMCHARPGEIYVPRLGATRIADMVRLLRQGDDIPIQYIGIRPGEKIHEVLVSEEEVPRTVERDGFFVIQPILPELRASDDCKPALTHEFTSERATLSESDLHSLLAPYMPDRR